MNKKYIFLDETYHLQDGDKFYSINGFMTEDKELVIKQYKQVLKRSSLLGMEVKSSDRRAEILRKNLAKNKKIWENIQPILALQSFRDLDYTFYQDAKTINDQEVKLYQELLNEIIADIDKKYGMEKELIFQLDIDKNDKITKEYFEDLRMKYPKISINRVDSQISLGVQLADQINGAVRKIYLNQDENHLNDYFDYSSRLTLNKKSAL